MAGRPRANRKPEAITLLAAPKNFYVREYGKKVYIIGTSIGDPFVMAFSHKEAKKLRGFLDSYLRGLRVRKMRGMGVL